MDTWQKTVIQNNLPQLIEQTKCSPKFLSIFQCNSILGIADLDQLTTSLNLNGRLSQACDLYNLLVTRKRAYECLIKAAFECDLTGVFTILVAAFNNHSESSGFLTSCGIDLNMTKFLKKPVRFQGSTHVLEKCFGVIQKDNLHELLGSTLTASDFLKLYNSDESNGFVLVKNTVPETAPYYIERSLLVQNRIDPLVFQKNELDLDDIFVFKQMEWNQLSLLVAPNRTQRSTNQLQRLTVRFILLERNEDFDIICQIRGEKSVHLIDHKNEKYYLLKTGGNFRKIEKYILPDESTITEVDLVQKCIDGDGGKVICLSDTPGMGKSILLGNLAKKLTPDTTNALSIFVVLCEIGKQLENLKVVNSEIAAVQDILQKNASDNELGRKLVGIMLNSEKIKVNLFFDGFDEILPSHVETVKEFLKCCAKMPNTSLFVTTRPHMRHEMEKLFGVQSLKIQPFTLTDQIIFLQTYWCNKHNIASSCRLKAFAENCLSNLQKNMKSTERNIAGIPLQCALLAEVYLKEAKVCGDSCLDFHFHILPETNSVVGMYRNLVKMRFNEKADADSFETLEYIHARYALDLIFPYWSDNLTSLFKVLPDNTDSDNNHQITKLYNIGILEEGASHTPRFVHRTLAEYFIAKLVIKVLKEHNSVDDWTLNQFKSFLWRTILEPQHDEKVNMYTFHNSTICYFLNEELSAESKNFPLFEDLSISIVAKSITKENLFQILICCVGHELGNIFQIVKSSLTEICSNSTCNEACSTESKYGNLLLLKAAKYASADLFQECYKLVRSMKEFMESTKSGSSTPLAIAVKRGNYPIVEFLLSTYYDMDSLYGQCLLHTCVIDSSGEEIGVVNERVEIIKLLLKKQPRLLNEKNSFGYTALLGHKIHLKLIECLIESRADLRGRGAAGSSILHRAPSYMTPQEYHSLVCHLIKINCGALMNIQAPSGRTALHEAVICLELEEKTIELISTIPGTDFDEKDVRGNTVLYCAVGGGRNLNLLNCIIKHGGNWKAKNYFKSKMLHIASKKGNVEAIRLFLSLGANVNSKNKHGRTPLHLALRWANIHIHEMVAIFIDNGANVNSVDVFRKTPLWIAMNSRNSWRIEPCTITLLKQAGAKDFPPMCFRLIPCLPSYRDEGEYYVYIRE